MTIPGEVQAILANIDKAMQRGETARTLLGMVRDWADADAIYDPVTDRYAIRLPGELVRRISRFAFDF